MTELTYAPRIVLIDNIDSFSYNLVDEQTI